MASLEISWAAVHNIGGFLPRIMLYGFASSMAVTLPAVMLPQICSNLAVDGTRLGILYACAGVGFLILARPAHTSAGNSLGPQV